jgi:phospho-N-acetylmuramoyl-pentapeptide-transferase
MLTFLAELSPYLEQLKVFRYITFRTGWAATTGYVLVFWFGPAIASVLLPKQWSGRSVRAGPLQWLTRHSLILLTATIIASLLWANPTNQYVWMGIFVAIVLAALGVFDDYLVVALIAAAAFGFLAYMAGNAIFANYLQIRYVPGMGELTVVCGALVGAGIASI